MKKQLVIFAITLFSLPSLSMAETVASTSRDDYSISAASSVGQPPQAPNELFTYVYDFESLKDMVMKSIGNGTPVLIEFYASWCHYCQAADRNVFSDPQVQKAMQDITVIRVDASEGTPKQVEMMDSYKINGFPSFITYDKNGVMRSPSELNDGVTKPAMLKLLNKLKS